jgi:hypothetical protein
MRLRLKTYLVSKNACLTKQQPLIWKKTRNFLIYLMSKHANSFGFTTIGIKKQLNKNNRQYCYTWKVMACG